MKDMVRIVYPCWYCHKELEHEKHYFCYEFDTPICLSCMEKLKNNPDFANDGEGDIIREEFKIEKKKR